MASHSSPHMPIDADRTSRTRVFISKALLIVYLAALVIHATATGPNMRTALDRENTQHMAEEDHVFCQGLGKPTGTPDFAACTQRLAEITARHKDRVLRDLSPIL